MVDGQAARQPPGFSLRSPGASGLTEFATSVTVEIGPSMVAEVAGGTALGQLGNADIEAFGPGAELRDLVTSEDGRQFVWLPQNDQAAIVGRSLGSVAHKYHGPQGDKLSADAEVLFKFISLGRGGNCLHTLPAPTLL